jgi:hypothetical protein
MRQTLTVLDGRFAVCRLAAGSAPPEWALASPDFASVTRTPDEVSIVCRSGAVPEGVLAVRDWRCVRVEGQLDFELTGVMASLAVPLAEAGVSIFVVNTYDTDYVFVREVALDRAVAALEEAGHAVRR